MELLALLVAAMALVFGGFYRWARKSGLVEAQSAQVTGSGSRVGVVAPLVEPVAYVGAILVLAGGGAAIGQRWDALPDWGHVAVFGGATAFFLTVGAVVLGVQDRAAQRMVGFAWFLSSAAVFGAAASLVHDVLGWSGEVTTLTAGVTMSAYAAALSQIRRLALVHVVLFVGGIVTIFGTINTVTHGSGSTLSFVLALWAFGLLWALLGWRRYLEPIWIAVPLGVLLALFTPSFAVTDHGWVYVIAVATAALVMVAGVPLRNTVLLGIGTFWMFAYVTSIVVHYFGGSLGGPVLTAVIGAFILLLATIVARLVRVATPPKAGQPVTDRSPEPDLPKVQ